MTYIIQISEDSEPFLASEKSSECTKI